MRRQLLEGLDQKELILEDYVRDVLGGLLDKYCGKDVHPEDWDTKSLKNQIFTRLAWTSRRKGSRLTISIARNWAMRSSTN